MIRPLDAWVLRRLVAGEEVDGEAIELAHPFDALARRLEGLPIESRGDALSCFLEARDDADEIIRAMAEADPMGPAPVAGRDEPEDDWPALRFGGLPKVEPFPVDVLPEPARRLVVEGADAIGCPRDFLALPVLAVAGGTIGRSVALFLKPNYFAGATINAGSVGPPSDGKTPALKSVVVAVRRIDSILEAEHDRAMERWKEAASAEGPDKTKSKPPPAPKPRRIDVDDITMEAIPIILADNPRGLIMIRDELTAFIFGMNQFKAGKGNDRANALKLWSGDAITKDRVGHENNIPIRCSHPTLSIVGGLPPDMLGSLLDAKGRSDGFIDRYLVTYPDSMPISGWSDRGIPEETSADWCELVARIWARAMDCRDGRPVPHVAYFSPEGKAAWTGHYDAHAEEMNREDFPPTMRGPWGKLREYAGRLTLILACMNHAADPTADPGEVPAVGPRIVDDAWRLIRYFKSHTSRVHAAIALGSETHDSPAVKAIVRWLREGGREAFSEREIKQARRWIEEEDLAEALKTLSERNAIRPRESVPEGPRPGRPASPVYEVNPALLTSHNTQNPRNDGPGTPDNPGFEGSEYSERDGEADR